MNETPPAQEAPLTSPSAQTLQDAGAEQVHGIINQQVLDNEIWRWGALFISIVAAYAAGKMLSYALLVMSQRAARKGHNVYASLLNAASRTMVVFAVVVGLSIGQHFLNLPAGVAQGLHTGIALLFTLACGLFAWRMVDVITDAFRSYAARTDNKMDDMLVPILHTSLRVTVGVFVAVQVIQIFSDKQVTSILAGLGIGGLAVALAAQDSIKNVFGSVVIFADKPFTVGDRIVVDNFDGSVEQVGMRSTRIRTLTGHQVTIPNGELANKSIENIARRPSIRRLLNVTITYDTPPAKVKRAVEILEEILAVAPMEGGRKESGSVNNPNFPSRVYFSDFNADSLNIIVLYWYTPADYWDYMAYSQWFNFQLLERYNAEGIEFAFPTQTLFLAGDTKRPLDFAPLRDGNLPLGDK
ncbi:MAG: mechanosensitive ion channel family protein [Opitutales bacterium]|nr:mechanosensitive ion channel family protein [Opitutales bacterium]